MSGILKCVLALLAAAALELDASQTEVDWKRLMPAIETLVKRDLRSDTRYPVQIVHTVDITGDGVPEALVNTGDGGAYTDYLTLIRVEGNKPVLARFKEKDGSVRTKLFAKGSSVMHGETVETLPEKRALYVGHWDMDASGQQLATCTVEAYRWNSHSSTFDYNGVLGLSLKDGFCRRIAGSLRGQAGEQR